MRRPLLIVYGLANAVLYSAILPLWEGFDEPFHFAYVQYLANGRGLPDPRSSLLSREVAASIAIAPASNVVKLNLPRVATYSDFFSWPLSQRTAAEMRLHEIPHDWRWQPSNILIYEAQHPPLAYLLLAGPERMLARVSLPDRVLILRILGALAGATLLYLGASKLYSELGLPETHALAAIFCVFSLQMTWASLAHVGNDWLAIPLAVCSLAAMTIYCKRPRTRSAAGVAALISAGLWTKAYFLALIPAALIVCFARKRWKDLAAVAVLILIAAGPWYVRNVAQYSSLSGMQETRNGLGLLAILGAAPALNWPRAAITTLRDGLWTGNNSFTSFSLTVETAIIALWVAAVFLWAIRRHEPAEWPVVLYCGLFAAALIYVTMLGRASGGVAIGPRPWYSQMLVAPMLGLAFLGCARSHRVGRLTGSILAVLFGYVLIATYVVKLIPLYGGFEQRTSLSKLWKLYSTELPGLIGNLDLLCLAPARLIFGLTAAVIALAIALLFAQVRSAVAN